MHDYLTVLDNYVTAYTGKMMYVSVTFRLSLPLQDIVKHMQYFNVIPHFKKAFDSMTFSTLLAIRLNALYQQWIKYLLKHILYVLLSR